MKPCPECGGELKRMYSKEYLDEHYPVNSPKDKSNMNIQIESKRLFECSDCDYKKTLSRTEYIAYILEMKKRGL